MDIILANVNNLSFKGPRRVQEHSNAISSVMSNKTICDMFAKPETITVENANDKIDTEILQNEPVVETNGDVRNRDDDRKLVCKFWSRGLCKKGKYCNFLHQGERSIAYQSYGRSTWKSCPKRGSHSIRTNKDFKIRNCSWYERGNCRYGSRCWNRHVKNLSTDNAANYNMKNEKFIMSPSSANLNNDQFKNKMDIQQFPKQNGDKYFKDNISHQGGNGVGNFGDDGCDYTDNNTTWMEQAKRDNIKDNGNTMNAGKPHAWNYRKTNMTKTVKSIEEITCFKCGKKGHYASSCAKEISTFFPMHRTNKY